MRVAQGNEGPRCSIQQPNEAGDSIHPRHYGLILHQTLPYNGGYKNDSFVLPEARKLVWHTFMPGYPLTSVSVILLQRVAVTEGSCLTSLDVRLYVPVAFANYPPYE